MLPQKSEAFAGKPRGEEELKKLFKAHTKRGAISVTDSWSGSIAALKRRRRSPQHNLVNNHRDWRNGEGWHSNGAESENGRVRIWARTRYGKLPNVSTGLLQEYMFAVNVGRTFENRMEAVSFQSDGIWLARTV